MEAVAEVAEASVRHGPGVEPAGGEDAGGYGCAGAGLADGDDRPVGGQIIRRRLDEAVGDVPAAGQRSLLALIGLAYVDQLRVVGEKRVQLVDLDRVDAGLGGR